MTEYEELGTQFDGEPAPVEQETVAPPEPEVKPESEATEEAPETTPEQEEEHKRKSGVQRLKEKARLAQEEAEYWKAQALKGAPEQPKPQHEPVGKPRIEDFQTHAEWVEAVTDWKVDQKIAEREAKTKQASIQQSWQEKAAAAREKYEDFDEALSAAPNPSQAVAEVIFESPLGADLAHYLATHPDEYNRINKLSGVAAARELGLIESTLKPKQPEQLKKPTKAPPPITPVAPSAAAPVTTLHPKFEEF